MREFSQFIVENHGGTALVTLSRPDQMNTFNPVMMLELLELFDLTDNDDAIRAIVVTGSGRAFCAGADLGTAGANTFNYEKRDASAELVVNGVRRDGGGRVALRIFRSLKPVICAFNGAAVGVGATLPLAMDFRIASTSAKFGFVFARRGITPEACSSWFLPRLVGMPTALDWCYSGRIFGAEEALEKGLVQSLHAPEDLVPAAMELARQFTAESAPVSIALTRQLMWRMQAAPHPMEAHKIDSRALKARGAAGDSAEGIASFKEKRPADFPDKVSADMPDLFGEEPRFV